VGILLSDIHCFFVFFTNLYEGLRSSVEMKQLETLVDEACEGYTTHIDSKGGATSKPCEAIKTGLSKLQDKYSRVTPQMPDQTAEGDTEMRSNEQKS
jgi:hypothetical protein